MPVSNDFNEVAYFFLKKHITALIPIPLIAEKLTYIYFTIRPNNPYFWIICQSTYRTSGLIFFFVHKDLFLVKKENKVKIYTFSAEFEII